MNFFDTAITNKGIDEVVKCLESGLISAGKRVAEFEQAVENKFGYQNCVSTNSGTSALHLALKLCNIGSGDEVIISAQTFVATGLAVLYCNATPVFADIDMMTGNLSALSVLQKITERTKAVIFVSWGGNVGGIWDVASVCKKHGVFLVHDAAHSFGIPSHVLNQADVTCFSFQAIKMLTSGDGGMLSCKHIFDYHEARRLSWFGIDRDVNIEDDTGERVYNLQTVGYKYHMNNIAASLALGNLDAIDGILSRREEIADTYDEAFCPLSDYRIIPVCKSPINVHWLYTILIDDRPEFIQMMKSKGIPVSVVHVGIDRNDIFGGKRHLTNQRYWDEHHICLPINSQMHDDDVQTVIDAVIGGW